MQTFVVRLWSPQTEPEATEPFGLHGVLEHVGSGGTATFRGSEELLELLARLAVTDGVRPDPRT